MSNSQPPNAHLPDDPISDSHVPNSPSISPQSSITHASASYASGTQAPSPQPHVPPVSDSQVPVSQHPRSSTLAPPAHADEDEKWKQPESQESPKLEEWVSFYIKPPSIIIFAVFTMGLLVGIAVLLGLSKRKNGFAVVTTSTTSPAHIGDFDLSVNIAWTSVPTFIITVYAFYFAAMARACAARQPYVDLYAEPGSTANPEGARLKQTLLLNYAAYPQGKNIFMAVKRRHPLLVVGFILVPILSPIFTALSAHLFILRLTTHMRPVVLSPSTTFQVDGIGAETDLAPALDVASATLVFGGETPPWTSFKYSFQSFVQPSRAVGNVSGLVQASSAYLDCIIINSTVLQKQKGSVKFTFYDGGCLMKGGVTTEAVNGSTYTTNAAQVYVYSNTNCGGGRAGDSRLAVVSLRETQSGTPQNEAVISCRPYYRNHTGLLQVDYSVPTNGEPKVLGFAPESTLLYSPGRPTLADSFETGLTLYNVDNTQNAAGASDFGRLIASYASHIHGTNSPSPEELRNATVQAFATVYVFATIENAWQKTDDATPTSGTVYLDEQKLFVYVPFAAISMGILGIVLIYLVWMYLYIKFRSSVLYEDPRTIMGAFTLLRDNQFLEEVEKNGHADIKNGKVWEGIANPDGSYPVWKFWKTWKTERNLGRRTRLSTSPNAMTQGWFMTAVDDARFRHVEQTTTARRPSWKAEFSSNQKRR